MTGPAASLPPSSLTTPLYIWPLRATSQPLSPLVPSQPHSSSHSQAELCPLYLFVLQVRGEFVAVRQGLVALDLLLLLLPQGHTGWLEASPLSPGKAHPSRGTPHMAAAGGQLAQTVGGLAPRTIDRCAQVTAWGITLHTVGLDKISQDVGTKDACWARLSVGPNPFRSPIPLGFFPDTGTPTLKGQKAALPASKLDSPSCPSLPSGSLPFSPDLIPFQPHPLTALSPRALSPHRPYPCSQLYPPTPFSWGVVFSVLSAPHCLVPSWPRPPTDFLTRLVSSWPCPHNPPPLFP